MTQCAENYVPNLLALPAAHERCGSPVIRTENPLTASNWNEWVARVPNCSFFHSSAWASVLQETYHFKPIYFTVRDGSNLRGLLPVMEVDSWLTGRRGISLPFTDACEMIGSDAEVLETLYQKALELGKSRHWKYFELRGEAPFTISENHADARTSLSFFSHVLDLTGGEAKVHASFASSVRRAIRKSETDGVKVEISSTLEAMRVYYDLHCKTRKKHGVPPQSFAFFANIQTHVMAKDMGFVAIARVNQRPIAASIFFHFGKKAIYKYGASDEAFLNLRGNNLVMWHAIRCCVASGCDSLDFGRTSLENDGLRRFKIGWGARENRTDYFRYDFLRKRYIAVKDNAMTWQNRIVSALPIRVSQMAGSFLYRHVA